MNYFDCMPKSFLLTFMVISFWKLIIIINNKTNRIINTMQLINDFVFAVLHESFVRLRAVRGYSLTL